jgi:aquaporin Z
MKTPWGLYVSECVGTALLITLGLSVVILDFGTGSPVPTLIPDPGLRRLLTGFLFGTIGALIAVSPVGKISGAHINPVVTLAFWLKRKIGWPHALAYVAAQVVGAVAGGLPLLAWGNMGSSIEFGATFPGKNWSASAALIGETITSFLLVASLFYFLGQRRLRAFTPLLFPFLYAAMVWVEAPISGTSTNPARSLSPALISGVWHGWWIYWLGPVLGSVLAVGCHRLPWLEHLKIEVAKIYHFEQDRYGFFRRFR